MLAANESYARDFRLAGLQPRAARGLAVLTCIDSRIEPLKMLGLAPGDAKILRNAGARVTDDVLRTLVLATYLLGVDRAMVVAHTNCRMAAGDEDDVHAAVTKPADPTRGAWRSWSRATRRRRCARTSSACGRGRISRGSSWGASSTTSRPAGSPRSAEREPVGRPFRRVRRGRLRSGAVELPGVGHALEVVRSVLLEGEPGPGDEILDGA